MRTIGPLSLALLSTAAADKIRGSSDDLIENKYSVEVRRLAEEARNHGRALAAGRSLAGHEDHDDKYGYGSYNEYDGGAGCNCAKDAVKYITHAHAEAVQAVPMTTMAMLEKHKDDIWDMASPFGYEPLNYYTIVTGIVQDIVKYANCVLLQIDCNQCGVDGYPHSSDEDSDEDSYSYRPPGPKTPYEGISHYECCCDVDAIKKLVIDHMNDFFLKALLNPGGAEFVAMNLETLFHSLISTINLLAEPYEDHFRFECMEPEFPPIPTPFAG